MPEVRVQLSDGPLHTAMPWRVPGAGAVICFEGVVRPQEDGRAISALRYEAYEPMSTRQLEALAARTADRFALAGVWVEHSVGVVPNEAVSFRLRVASAHRVEVLAATEAFIDEMKRDVALWKTPVFAEAPEETTKHAR